MRKEQEGDRAKVEAEMLKGKRGGEGRRGRNARNSAAATRGDGRGSQASDWKEGN